jgi:hypothetical protein
VTGVPSAVGEGDVAGSEVMRAPGRVRRVLFVAVRTIPGCLFLVVSVAAGGRGLVFAVALLVVGGVAGWAPAAIVDSTGIRWRNLILWREARWSEVVGFGATPTVKSFFLYGTQEERLRLRIAGRRGVTWITALSDREPITERVVALAHAQGVPAQ